MTRLPFLIALAALATAARSTIARADGDLTRVNHLVFMMQENRSFDDYFGALPYVPGGPYHPCEGRRKHTEHRCVDGLTCQPGADGELACTNSNPDTNGATVVAFHDPRICDASGLDH